MVRAGMGQPRGLCKAGEGGYLTQPGGNEGFQEVKKI